MGALSVNAFKDGAGTTVTGGLRMWDESGAGTGPWSQAPVSMGLVGLTNPDYSALDGATRPISIDASGRFRTLDLSSSAQMQAVAEAMGTDALLKVIDPDAAATLLQDLKGLKHWLKLINDRDATSVADTSPFITQDAGPSWTSKWGLGSPLARFTSANASAADAAVTDAPTSGQKLVIDDVLISVDTAMRVDLKEETTGTVKSSVYMAANTWGQLTFRGKRKLDTADKKLMVRTSASGNVSVGCVYHSEA